MANTCQLDRKTSSGTLSRRYSDESVSERFYVHLDAASRNLPAILNSARAANPTQFPLRGQRWPANPSYGLYADSFQLAPRSDLQNEWDITVTYMPLQPGEPNTEGSDNPLLWPATYSIDWIEYEEAITKAKNVQAIGSASDSGERAALTLGPVVNSALQEVDEGIFKTVRRALIGVHKNVSFIDQIFSIETQYADTTNSDTVLGVGPRRWEYFGVESSGQQVANGIAYYGRSIRVKLNKTTDREFNNVGWNAWVTDAAGAKKLAKMKVPEIDDKGKAVGLVEPAEPLFLALNGTRLFGIPETLSYRYLTEVAYASLLI